VRTQVCTRRAGGKVKRKGDEEGSLSITAPVGPRVGGCSRRAPARARSLCRACPGMYIYNQGPETRETDGAGTLKARAPPAPPRARSLPQKITVTIAVKAPVHWASFQVD